MTKIKDFWDKSHTTYIKNDLERKHSVFADCAISYFPRNGIILELGAGQGFDSLFFASNGYNIISTDISDTALNYIRKKLPKE